MNCYCDGDAPKFLSVTERTARVQHVCCECSGPIAPGARHRYVTGLWDGRISSFRQCEHCADLWDGLAEAGGCPMYGGLFEQLHNHFDFVGTTRRAAEIEACHRKLNQRLLEIWQAKKDGQHGGAC